MVIPRRVGVHVVLQVVLAEPRLRREAERVEREQRPSPPLVPRLVHPVVPECPEHGARPSGGQGAEEAAGPPRKAHERGPRGERQPEQTHALRRRTAIAVAHVAQMRRHARSQHRVEGGVVREFGHGAAVQRCVEVSACRHARRPARWPTLSQLKDYLLRHLVLSDHGAGAFVVMMMGFKDEGGVLEAVAREIDRLLAAWVHCSELAEVIPSATDAPVPA
mmetsp:Transcript_27059/g.87416  ORF Transcript_27059/g.87416 Transcript_27059/m.87416 type:complete len:220 (+) Transcript_27059:1025-1684(+)